MKLGLIFCALLCACSMETKPLSVFTNSDSGVSRQDAEPDHSAPSIKDAGMPDTKAPGYDPCVTKTTIPVTTGSESAQKCLVQNVCTDSLGQTYQPDLYDSCHDLNCRWRLTCNGGTPKTFCVPENEQSSPEYADDTCTKPIALVAFKNGVPATKYVGLDVYTRNSDAGDAGASSCIDIYEVGKPWVDNGHMYYLSLDYVDPTQWVCNETYINFPGTKMYYLSTNPVSPGSFFVEQ